MNMQPCTFAESIIFEFNCSTLAWCSLLSRRGMMDDTIFRVFGARWLREWRRASRSLEPASTSVSLNIQLFVPTCKMMASKLCTDMFASSSDTLAILAPLRHFTVVSVSPRGFISPIMESPISRFLVVVCLDAAVVGLDAVVAGLDLVSDLVSTASFFGGTVVLDAVSDLVYYDSLPLS